MGNSIDKTSPDPHAASLGDWRLANAAWVTAVDGEELEEPVAFHQVTVFNIDDSEQVAFQTPSAAALHLNSAWKAARRAQSSKLQLKMSTYSPHPGNAVRQVEESNSGTLYDYFEEMMLVAFSSFAAVEAFCNQTISDRSSAPISVKRKKRHELLSADEVERSVGTDEKLCRIVPDLLGVPSPSGKAVWASYLRIKGLRDAVTHFKRKDQARTTLTEPTALYRLFEADCFAMPESAAEVISHFFKDATPPRWLVNPNWTRSNPVGGPDQR